MDGIIFDDVFFDGCTFHKTKFTNGASFLSCMFENCSFNDSYLKKVSFLSPENRGLTTNRVLFSAARFNGAGDTAMSANALSTSIGLS